MTAASPPPKPTVPPKPAGPPRASEAPPPWLRPTIRIRLTVLYGGMFLIAGVLLLLIIYLVAAQALTDGDRVPYRFETGWVSVNSAACPGLAGAQSMLGPTNLIDADTFNKALTACMDHQRGLALADLLRRSLLALLGMTVLAFAFGYLMAGRVLSPLGHITRTARQVVATDLTRRIQLDGPDDELKELADTFDDMLDRLARSFESQRRFVANASHELRTPLAINRTLLEVHLADPEASPDLQELGRNLLATNLRSEQLVEGLLLLARSENELTEKKAVDLAEAVHQTVEQTRGEAQDRDVDLRTSLEPAVVQGSAVLLERVTLNLVQNAVRYNEPGGWVEVTTGTGDGMAVLTVSNTGLQVPAESLEAIFEPFRRLAERTGSDKGAGLGLSIVRSVVRAHGGTITASARETGGLVMRVAIPL